MKKIFTLIAFATTFLNASAQIESGYYRVTNKASGWFCQLVDKTYGMNGTLPKLHSLEVWNPEKFDRFSSPSTVIYVDSRGGNKYDLRAQGTSVKEIAMGAEVTIIGSMSSNTFRVIANKSGFTQTLAQGENVRASNSYYDVSAVSNNSGKLEWSVYAIDSKGDNYFGVKPTLTANGKHYAPFYAAFPFSFASKGMKAYIVTDFIEDEDVVLIEEVTKQVIPASTPLLIECSSENPSDNRLELLTGTYSSVGYNMLTGNYFCCDFIDSSVSQSRRIDFDPKTMRVWNVDKNGQLCLSTDTNLLHQSFYYDPDDDEENGRYLNANSSYLKVTRTAGTSLRVMTEEEYDGIEDVMLDNAKVSRMFSLDGKPVQSAQSGVNILKMSDGTVKKVLVK